MSNSLQRSPRATTESFEQRLRRKLGGGSGTGTNVDPGSATALLLDVSGSMRWSCGNGLLKIDELWNLVAKFPNVRRFTFSTTCKEIPRGTTEPAGGGTCLHGALYEVSRAGVTHAVLVTDGLPDSEPAALEAARKTGIRLDIFYVGPDPAPGFLRDLANSTGGQYGRASFGTGAAALASSIRGLLTA